MAEVDDGGRLFRRKRSCGERFVKKQVSRHWVGATSLVVRNHSACLAALLGPER
jgi:hypothetical protein